MEKLEVVSLETTAMRGVVLTFLVWRESVHEVLGFEVRKDLLLRNEASILRVSSLHDVQEFLRSGLTCGDQ